MKSVTRFEYKYLISYVDYLKIKNVISEVLIHDQHGENEKYKVNSIYFDDIVFSGASDKAFGNAVHKKYRVRYYNDVSKKKLELKKKTGDVSTKLSSPISEVYFANLLNGDFMEECDVLNGELKSKFILDSSLNHLTPSMIVSYDREAYKDESDNVRITFDHSLEASRYDEDPVLLKLMHDSMVILEMKYRYVLPNYLKEIINKIKPNQIAYSKYFMAYKSLGI